jgi:thiol:disulfide interchange protein DsbD
MSSFLTRIVFAALVWVVILPWTPGQARDAKSIALPFTLTVSRGQGLELNLHWTIAAGTYLYRDKIGATAPNGHAVPVVTTSGETKDDPNFGPTEFYHDRAEASVPGAALASLREVWVTYQGCAEQGICYPPVTKRIEIPTLALHDAGPEAATAVAPSGQGLGPWTVARANATIAEPARGPAALLSGSLIGAFAAFFSLGLLLAFTPCVLPMIPILSGLLARSGERLTAARGLALSSSYVLAMALAYGSLGVAAAWFGRNLQVALQTPVSLAAMSAVFVGLALSMFGLFELQPPRWWRERLTQVSGSSLAPMAGAAMLGFSSALIVGPCVTPPLAAALLYVAQTGDVVRSASALFALGLGMGMPLIAFGTFGAGILPKAGSWLVRSKQAFGFVFLGLAVSMLSRVLPPGMGLALWGALAVGIGVFVGAFDAVAIGSGAWGRAGKAGGIVAVAYGCALIVGAAYGASDPLRPLSTLGQEQATGQARAAPHIRTVASVPAFEAALQTARSEAKPVLLEFAADWCTVCKDNERTVFSDPAIQERLQSVSVIRMDVTRDDADSRALMHRFKVVGPPTLILLRPDDGTEVRDARTEGALAVDDLKRCLALAGA